MSQEHHYLCSSCGKLTRRSLLTVKKALFTGMGAGSKTLRARVVAWLCPECTVKDEDWNRPPHEQPNRRHAALLDEV